MLRRPEMSRLVLPGLAILLILGQGHPYSGPSRVLASTATSLTLHLQAGMPLEVDVETVLDHHNLWDPAGYRRPRRHGAFVRRLELENTGQRVLDQEAGLEQSQSREWLARVELHVDLEQRRRAAGEIKVALPFPILEAVYDSGERAAGLVEGEPQMEVVLDPRRADRATVVAHAAVRSLPDPLRGRNRFSIPAGPATLTLHWSPDPEAGPPEVAVEAGDRFAYRPIEFGVRSPRELETVWWQMSEYRDFHFVPPNWDSVVPYAARFELDPVSASLLTSGTAYYLRARGFDGRLWSDWSAVHELTVVVPPAPAQVALTETGGVHCLSWAGEADGETRFLVFGSNRRDFLPEIFGPLEVTEMRQLEIWKSRANRNLLGTTRQLEFAVESPRRYYRIVAFKDRSYSVPSALMHARTGPAGRVLQTRLVAEPADNEEGYVSRYLALEAAVPAYRPAGRE